jgi:pathogenesis-related protein 1
MMLNILLLTACQKEPTTPKKNTHTNITIPTALYNEALSTHNELRRLRFNAPLIYDTRVEKAAQKHADYLANTGSFHHDTHNLENKYGENLYAFSSIKKPNLSKIIKKWYSEKIYYDYKTRSCKAGKICGHYTQIVWKNSKYLGCASAKYKQGRFKNGYVTVCKYYPYGNIIGQDPY